MRRLLLNTASLAVAASALAAVHSIGAAAQDITIEGNVALVSDYRFRGVSMTDEFAAIQGGFDATHSSGLYAGTWASSIDQDLVPDGKLELDLYGGYGFEAAGVDIDLGAIGYFYPGSEDLEYGEVYGSVTEQFGNIEGTFGVNYAPEQDNLGEDDNTYAYVSAGMPLSETFSLSGLVGYSDGVFDFSADEDGFWNWELGVTTNVMGLDVGVSYVDTSEDFEGAQETAVFKISKAM
jgi:uncharacterized protein (TIGR02001 family)